MRIWQGLPTFQFKSTVRTWVYRVAINTAIDHLRQKKKISELKPEALQQSEESQVGWHEVHENQQAIQWALQQIEPDMRSILTLHYFEELKVEEIAAILEVPVGTVKSRLSTARQQLKSHLTRKGVVL